MTSTRPDYNDVDDQERCLAVTLVGEKSGVYGPFRTHAAALRFIPSKLVVHSLLDRRPQLRRLQTGCQSSHGPREGNRLRGIRSPARIRTKPPNPRPRRRANAAAPSSYRRTR